MPHMYISIQVIPEILIFLMMLPPFPKFHSTFTYQFTGIIAHVLIEVNPFFEKI